MTIRLRRVRQFFLAFCAGVALYGFIVAAQTPLDSNTIARNEQKIYDLDQRVKGLEAERLDARVSNLETIATNNHDMLIAIFICLFGLSVEAMFRLARYAIPPRPKDTQ